MIDQKDGRFLCTAFGKGRQHDFALFKKSKIRLTPAVMLLGDSGYQGIQNLIQKVLIPVKATKQAPLTKAEKADNRILASVRVKVENALAFIKRFRIFSSRYRNRARRFGLRFNLFAAICNLEISLL